MAMKEITLRIPEHKYAFVLELMKQLGIETSVPYSIPEEHQALVRERIATTPEEDFLPWEEARKKLKKN
jgi:hypothetical protein